MVSYQDIKKANESLQATPIKGKDYIEVNQRIKAFRMVYPDGFIQTRMISNNDGVCVFVAECGFYEGAEKRILGTGTAYENEQASYINKTSYIENCETSAVGRALGMAGFGIEKSIASAEEVENAIAQQDAIKTEEVGSKKITPGKVKALNTKIESDKVDGAKLCAMYGIQNLSDLTEKQFSEICNTWTKEIIPKCGI